MPKESKGMNCPNGCGPLAVKKTRKAGRGLIVRRRVCVVCNYRETTHERKCVGRVVQAA